MQEPFAPSLLAIAPESGGLCSCSAVGSLVKPYVEDLSIQVRDESCNAVNPLTHAPASKLLASR